MQLSVIILNYNVKHFLEVCLKSVQKAIATIDAEIIVVDNASTDGSKEMMHSLFPEITYLYQKENSGFPKGNNIGVNLAKGEFICILNPDTIVAEDTFVKLIEEYTTLENPGILGCHLIDGAGNFLPESKRGIPTPWVAFTKVLSLYQWFPNNKWFNQYYAQHLNENQKGNVDILVGAFMLMKRSLYLEVGGFDEGCFMYSDDIDLSYLSIKNGKKNYYVPYTSVIHFKGESTLKDGLYMKRFKEAMQFFYKKHFNKSFLFDTVMKIGIFIFAFKKKTEKGVTKQYPDLYLYFGSDMSVLHSLKQQHIHVEQLNNIDELSRQNNQIRVEYLFDAESISYKQYINFLIQNKKSNKTFKIRPENAHFFIGSNDKNDKGEILFV